MTEYDKWAPLARKLINGLAAKPGIHFVDRAIATQLLAQALHGADKRGELRAVTENERPTASPSGS